MPKIVKLRRFDPPDLLSDFSAQQINNASGTEFGSGIDYVYKGTGALRLWIRFTPGAPTDLVNYDPSNKPTIVYEGGSETSTLDVYSSRMQSARFSDDGNKNALLTFPGVSGNNNIISFGNGTSRDLPFSVSLWFRKIPDPSSELDDYFFAKAKSNTTMEYVAFYQPGNKRIYFRLHGAGSNNDIYQGIYATVVSIADENWHHIVFTYDGRGTSGGAVPSAGMKIYVDGISQSTTVDSNGVYTYMDDVSNELGIGTNRVGAYEADGHMAEFAIWGKELSDKEIGAIYNWTYNNSVIKSGYTNIPPRVRLRELDNRSGHYPSKHRMGDRDRTGQNTRFYEDFAIQFGNKIEDEFDIDDNVVIGEERNGDFDISKWTLSAGMTIRREVREEIEGEFVTDPCAVFSGPGSGTPRKRFIQTANKIRNPYFVQFDLLQGPYNIGLNRLNLRRARPDGILFLQIATDAAFTTPITVASYEPDPIDTNFFGLPTLNKKPSKTVKLGLENFIDPGASYYIRLTQERFTSRSNWAIRNIKICYANQNVRYPLNLNYKDTASNKIAAKLIGNRHASGSLAGIGRSLKSVSDTANPFNSFEESVSPFNDTLAIETPSTEFFQEGLDPEIYPGFTAPAKSKTKFTIDFNTSEQVDIGHFDNGDFSNSSEMINGTAGFQLMCYWNKDAGKWQRVGKPFEFPAGPPRGLLNVLTSSCVGFGPRLASECEVALDSAGSPSEYRLTRFHDRNIYKQAFTKTTAFDFPYGIQYHATSSQTMKARDFGITKPFLLEKCSIEFQSKFEFYPGVGQDGAPDRGSFSNLRWHGTGNVQDGFLQRAVQVNQILPMKLVVPTFFMLRQFKDNFTYEQGHGPTSLAPYTKKMPTTGSIVSGSDNEKIFIDTNRSLVTFGQLGLYVTGTQTQGSTPVQADGALQPEVDNLGVLSFPWSIGFVFDNDRDRQVRCEDFIEAGLSFDSNFVADMGTSFPGAVTGSFVINFNSQIAAPNLAGVGSQPIQVENDAGTLMNILPRNLYGRSNNILKNARGLVNGVVGVEPETTEPGFTAQDAYDSGYLRFQETPLPDAEKQTQNSPYIILPDDDLIFGWQYPPPTTFLEMPHAGQIHHNKMSLFGRSKLHLYGSEIVENKQHHETTNQQLTSNAVYEHIIGDEKIIDQWQVAYRDELTGSFISRQAVNYSIDPGVGFTGLPDNPGAIPIVLGPTVYGTGITTITANDINKINAIQRIALRKVSAVGDHNEKVRKSLVEINDSTFTGTQAASFAFFVRPFFNPGNFNSFKMYPEKMKYRDGNASLGAFYDGGIAVQDYKRSSYGTMIRGGQELGVKGSDNHLMGANPFRTADWLKGQGPKYNFNTKHFGYYFDMFQQGLDSRFEPTPGEPLEERLASIIAAGPPVRSRFVSGTFKPNSEQKVYTRARVEFLLDDFRFQSSNLSTAMTSSCPFIEDETNRQNAPSNRRYESSDSPIITIPI